MTIASTAAPVLWTNEVTGIQLSDSPWERLQRLAAREIEPPPVARLIGLDLVSAGAGAVTMALEVGPQHANPMGTVHGGILCDLADAAMGMAYASTLGAGESFTTLELKINFLRPVWNGRLIAEGKYVSGGSSVGLTECDIKDERGRLVAHATSTCMTLRGQKAAGR
ncbi:MAG: PaaI family thioesterase [Dehalococcoidia bacterium]